MRALIGGIALSLMVATTMFAETANDRPSAVIIPLKDIWACEMAGTRDVRELEPNNFGEAVRNLSSEEKALRLHGSLTTQIQQSLRFDRKKLAGPCFAVVGTGKEALKRAYEVLVEKKEPLRSFRSGDQLSVVFYSYQFGSAVQLQSVALRGNTIEIQYAFIPHRTLNITTHFALIPVGKLPQGAIDVHIQQVPHERPANANELTDHAIITHVICDSCKFSITKN